jgi:hypothetical protein
MSRLSSLRFSPAIQSIQLRHRQRLENLYRGIQPQAVIALDGVGYGRSHGLSGTNEIDMLDDPRGWLADVLADMAARIDLLADEVTFRPPVIELDPFGVHFIDALFGAPIRFQGDQTWSDELEIDLDALECPNLSRSPVFQKTLRLAELAAGAAAAHQADGAGEIFVATPVFSCAINIGINLFGERLLEGLHTRPEAAQQALEKINRTILQAAAGIAAVIPEAIRRNSVAENRLAPAGVGQFDGCATQLVSRRDYARFFAPLDEALIGLSPGGALMHICGAHAQHIPTWKGMPGLRAVQLNDRAMDDLAAYYQKLRSDTIFYLCPSLQVNIEKIMELTRGRRVILQVSLDDPIPLSPKFGG